MKKRDSERLINEFKDETNSIISGVNKDVTFIDQNEKFINDEKEYIDSVFRSPLENELTYLPKSVNDFLFAENKSNQEKFQFQKNAIFTAIYYKQTYNNLLAHKNEIDNTEKTIKSYQLSNKDLLETNFDKAKQKAIDVDEHYSNAVKKRRTLGIIFMILGLLGLAFVAYRFIAVYLPALEIIKKDYPTGPDFNTVMSAWGVSIGLLSLVLEVALFFLIFGIIKVASKKKGVPYLDHMKQIGDIKEVSMELINSKKDKASIDRLADLALEYEKYNSELDKLINKYNEFMRKYIYIYLPNIRDNELSRVNEYMNAGVVTSYSEAILKVQDDIKHERERAEDKRAQEQFNAELLASQKRAEAYTREAAENARRQAQAAERQLEVAKSQAEANERFQREQARKLDKEIKKDDKARQEARDYMNRS